MEAMKDLRSFILIMVILAFVWLFTGGPLRPSSKSGWFLNKPQQKATQEVKKQTEEITGTSYSAGKNSQSSLPKQSSSASSPLPYFRGDDGHPPISSSSRSDASYNNMINNSASIVYAAKSKLQSSSSQSSTRPDFITLKTRRAKETNPDEEYIEIKADKKTKAR